MLVFGSLNLDHVYRVPHLVRPGETIGSLEYQQNPGGKGLNQALALSKAGSPVRFAGAVGRDGQLLLDTLKRHGVDTSRIAVLDHPSGHAMIQVDDQGNNSIVLYGGTNRLISREMIGAALKGVKPGEGILLQNEVNGLQDILRAARQKGMVSYLNPSPISAELKALPFHLVDWLLLNEVEAQDLTGEADPARQLDALLVRAEGLKLVLTLGASGSWYADKAMRHYQPAVQAEVVDTTAAGDTYTGYLLDGLHRGLPIAQAMARAARAAAITVSRPGAGQSIPYASEVDGDSAPTAH